MSTSHLVLNLLAKTKLHKMENNNIELLKTYGDYLAQKRYSYSTINAYKQYVKEYLTNLKIPIEEVPEIKITCYLAGKIMDVYKSYYARDRFVEAFILFFKHVVGKDYNMHRIAGKNYEHKLPLILSQTEICKIIDNTTNIKHKTLLSLIYFAGLRLEELINLKISDVDISKREITIYCCSKGSARIIKFHARLGKQIKEYLYEFEPEEWLFEGRGNKQYSSRSVQMVLKKSLDKNKINSLATPSTIRHSLAAHLVENGTDINLVKDYLGICSVKYAKRYTQIVKIPKLDLCKNIEKKF